MVMPVPEWSSSQRTRAEDCGSRRGRELRWGLLLLLAAAGIGLSGCATNEENDNASARPWGAPGSGWNTGSLPSSMTEGR